MDIDKIFYEPGYTLMRQGAAADDAQPPRLSEAISCYEQAVERFIQGIKFDAIDVRVQTVIQKADRCLERIALLKEHESNSRGGGGGGAQTGSGAVKVKKPGEGDGELNKLKDSLLGSIVSTTPNVKWSDVAGLEGAKDALKEAVVLPIKFPQLFQGERKPWRGILMYGPPGTGKSFLAKAVATEVAGCFMSVTPADLFSKWQGEAEKLVRSMFVLAREKKPTIVSETVPSVATAKRCDCQALRPPRVATAKRKARGVVFECKSTSRSGSHSEGLSRTLFGTFLALCQCFSR